MAPVLARSLNRLSREALIDLALKWLQQDRASAPYLLSNRSLFEADEEDYLHTPAESIESLRTLYRGLRKDGTQVTKRDVIDRIVDGDWRRGLSLHQHATIDFAYLEQNDTALRWSALRLVPLEADQQGEAVSLQSEPPKTKRKLGLNGPQSHYPHVSAQSFLSALKSEVSPLVKAHYHLHQMPAPYNLAIIRLYITPNTAFRPGRSKVPRRVKHATDAGRVMYIALPNSCPYVYISISGSSSGPNGRSNGTREAKGKMMAKVDMAAMKRIVLEAIPKAVSRPQSRWALESTKLVARSLKSMCELRGNQKPGSGGGAYGIFAAADEPADNSPVDFRIDQGKEVEERQCSIEKRFGPMTGGHRAALDRVNINLQNVLPQSGGKENDDNDLPEQERADITLTFSGGDVFLGLKKLAELGPYYVELDRLPAWMTGELGVSTLTV